METLELPIEGMTCASCVARVEKKLNTLDGVRATVNLATERATVDFDPALVGPDDLRRRRRRRRLPRRAARGSADAHAPSEHDPALPWRRRFLVSAVLAAPVLLLAMVPPLQFAGWEWLSLALATPVVLWGGWPFHRAALVNLRHRAATMDTLISVGTLAAWGWSVVVLAFLEGEEIYLEVAAVVTVLILLGRWLETRAQAPGRRRAPLAARARREGRARAAGRGGGARAR